MEGRTNTVIDVFLQGWQLTRRAARGGLMLDYLASVGREDLLFRNFKPLIPGLKAKPMRTRYPHDWRRGAPE